MSEVMVERQGETLNLTLNRPDKMNALSASVVDTLLEQVQSASQSDVRLLVIKGSGRNFCAGFDFTDFDNQSDGDLLLRFVRIEQLLQGLYYAPFHTLALAHGKNFGAGVDIICSCSERVADSASTFRMPGLSFGVVLGTRRLAERLGMTSARHVLQTGSTFNAAEGLQSKFLTCIAPMAEWPATIQHADAASQHLSRTAALRLNHVTTTDTRAEDMADLVASVAEPGLKERIRTYRA